MTPCASSSPVEGRLQRFGKWLEYDNWINNTAPAALRVGRSAALATIPMGETVDFADQRPQLVRRLRRAAPSAWTLPANFTAAVTVEAVRAAGRRAPTPR